MFWTITAMLGMVWLAGTVSSHTMGGYIHLLLAAAILMVLYRFFLRRRLA